MTLFKNFMCTTILFFSLCFFYGRPVHAQVDSYKELFQSCDANQKKFITEMEKRDNEIALLKAETSEVIRRQLAEIDRLKTTVAGLYEMLDAYSNSPLQKEKYMGRLQAELRNKNSEIEPLKTRLASAESTIASYAKKLEDKDRQISSLSSMPGEGDKEGLKKELTDLKEASSKKDNELNKLRMEFQEKLVEIKILANLVDEKNAVSADCEKNDQEIKQLHEELEAKETELAKLESENLICTAEIEKLTTTTKQQQTEISRLSEELSKKTPVIKKMKKTTQKENHKSKKVKGKDKKKNSK